MRQMRGGWVVLVGVLVAAGPALANVPDWDWQATFVFDSEGEVTSSNLDLSSDFWIDCDQPWVVAFKTNDPTSNMTHMEILRVDTTNHIRGEVVQQNGWVNETREICPLATTIEVEDLGGPPPAFDSCTPAIVGGNVCSFRCLQDQVLDVRIEAGYSTRDGTHISAGCGSTSTGCMIQADLQCFRSTDPDLTTHDDDDGFCRTAIGIYVVAYCLSRAP